MAGNWKMYKTAAETTSFFEKFRALVERSGHDVAVVMGSPRNIKITTPADMELAEFYLRK